MIETFSSKTLSKLEVWLTAAGSLILSLAIINRWLVTPLGLKSYGRVWQNHISYLDIGFTRRTLWGTVLSITGLNKYPSNEYLNAFMLHSLGLCALTLCVAFYMSANAEKLTRAHAFVVFFSPAFILHLSYVTGTVDYVLITMLWTSALYVRNFWTLGIIAALGALVNEPYLFFVPFLALNNALHVNSGRFPTLRKITISSAPIFLLPTAAMVAVRFFGASAPNKLEFESLMEHKLTFAAHQVRLWSGFFEIFSTIDQNVQPLHELALYFWHNMAFVAIPVLYLLILWTMISRSLSSMNSLSLTIYRASLILPLAISLVASDHLRWICMSAQLCLLSMITLHCSGVVCITPKQLIPLLPFSLTAPIGLRINEPFPIHRFIIKKLL